MNSQSRGAEIRSDSDAGDLSVVATRLIEAASFARHGDYDLAEAHIAYALALIQGQPSSMPVNLPGSQHRKRKIVRGGLMSWQVRRLKVHNIAATAVGPCELYDVYSRPFLSSVPRV